MVSVLTLTAPIRRKLYALFCEPAPLHPNWITEDNQVYSVLLTLGYLADQQF